MKPVKSEFVFPHSSPLLLLRSSKVFIKDIVSTRKTVEYLASASLLQRKHLVFHSNILSVEDRNHFGGTATGEYSLFRLTSTNFRLQS